ncbi:MAG: Inner membrane ABC transporter permease protein YejB [Pseudomonas citronellolis]|nr:MAG: Inner membrane ABC transporter permease protein YejB [Pseudomonas citronellolis]
MAAYALRRLLLILPTLLGILLINFAIIQAAPGGPVEQTLARLEGLGSGVGGRIAGNAGDIGASGSAYRGAQGLDPAIVTDIQKRFGFDKPAPERFLLMLRHYAHLDFGQSYYRDIGVTELIREKLPVSLSLGLWSTLILYLVSIPLGIAKAIRHGTPFDVWSSSLVIVGYAVPGFLFAMLLIVIFAGGSYLSWFPLRGLTSEGFEAFSPLHRVLDYAWHLVLPISALVVGGFAALTLLTKNSFLEEIGKQYVITARAKGLSRRRVLYGHVFRNAMLVIISGLPNALLGVFFTGSLLIEVVFSLDGLGLLSFESALNRDYPVVFGTLFIFTLFGLLLKLASDLLCALIDPRIDFTGREA